MSDRVAEIERTHCRRRGGSCFFVARIGNDWVCMECFGAHVTEVANALRAISKPTLVVFDRVRMEMK